MGDSSVADADMAITSKIEDEGDGGGTPSSIDSLPEQDAGAEPSQEPVQPQKRKGGRKPIYATSEERKQRNRQAQAAFRERRTEYIKQLEATIKQNEDALTTLQQNHRTAADECLMLRYKNSLLERILLEKGIDVQSELQMKTGSPILGPGFMHGPNVVQQSQTPLQRTALHQRHQARRSTGQQFLPKLAPGQSNLDMAYATAPPHAHPTPSSHASSPTQSLTRSPLTLHQGGMTPSTSSVLAQSQGQHIQAVTRLPQQSPNPSFYQASQSAAHTQRPSSRPATSSQFQATSGAVSNRTSGNQQSFASATSTNAGNASSNANPVASTFYPSPFQKHFDQLDQEYDAQHARSLLDDPDPEDPSHHASSSQLPGNYPPNFDPKLPAELFQHPSGVMHPGQQPMTPQTSYEQSHMMHPTSHPHAADEHFDVDPDDPMLDADPFGLTASMHYPTSYSFDPQNHGQR